MTKVSRSKLPDYSGDSAFGGALRFLSPDDSDLIEVIRENYGDLSPNIEFFAADAFGVYYGLNKRGKVAIFWTETADIEEIDVSQDEFYELILDDPDSTINLSFYRMAVETYGRIEKHQDFALKVESALGGAMTLENIYICDAAQHLAVLAKIARQIHSIPIGTRFKPDMPPGS
jgi:hypothetical protein